MQEQDGSMRILDETEHKHLGFFAEKRTVSVGQVFKLRRCYFEVAEIKPDGIVAKGISRKEYYDRKRGRPDWR